MATASQLPKLETIRLTPSGQKLTKDLTAVYLPDGGCNFFVHGSDRYVVLFSDPKVFGVSLAALKKGDNLFARVNTRQTECHIFTENSAIQAAMCAKFSCRGLHVRRRSNGPNFGAGKCRSTARLAPSSACTSKLSAGTQSSLS